jgi:hypothetical protein
MNVGYQNFPPCATIFLTDEGSSVRKWSSKEGRTKRASEEPVKVLIAEDEPLFRKILSQLLSPEFELTVTEEAPGRWRVFRKNTDRCWQFSTG